MRPANSAIIEKKGSASLNSSSIWAQVPKEDGVLGSQWKLTLGLSPPGDVWMFKELVL